MERKKVTHLVAVAILDCPSCRWARARNGCDFYNSRQQIRFAKDIASGKRIKCPDGITITSSYEAQCMINQ